MTPDQLVSALLAPPDDQVRRHRRCGRASGSSRSPPSSRRCRSRWTPPEFYDIVKSPPAELIDDYPWLKTDPEGRPEGRLARGLPVAGDLPGPARHDARGARPADARQVRRERRRGAMAVAKERGLNFYQVLTLASIVEREALLDAGEAAHRGGLPEPARSASPGSRTRSSTPTRRSSTSIDTLAARRSCPFEDWTNVRLLGADRGGLTDVTLLPEPGGLPDLHEHGPASRADRHADACTSIDAALEPDTAGQLHLLPGQARRRRRDAFAKTLKEHQANRQEVRLQQ